MPLSSTADFLSLSNSLQHLRNNLNRIEAKINRVNKPPSKNASSAKCERFLSRKVGNTGAGASG